MDISAPQMTPGPDASDLDPPLDAEKPSDVVLAPAEAFPRIDLRAQGEPWERRRAAGKQLRREVPHAAHAEAVPTDGRPDPVELVERSNAGRQARLVPLRIARMAESPFAFLRGAAGVMAFDLSRTPRSGIDVVMNGDAHISNFGLFGTPQRDVVLDLNDFDEVTIGPWEWDLKRLVASLNVVARQQEIGRGERQRIVTSCVEGYRRSMLDLAPRGPIDVWHRAARADRLDFNGIEIDADSQAALRKAVEKARRRDNASLLEKVGERQVDGGWRFRLDPPILTAVGEATREAVISGLEHYAESLPRERRFMLSRYHVVDVVHRVVGVGSVGTRAYLALLFGNSDQDALFLQVKEAITPSHAPYVPPLPEPYGSHDGARVVYGQRLLQAVGDPLLGWTTIGDRPFYVRQMKNMKGEIPHALLGGRSLEFFAFGYGALLARAHARTGDAAAIAGYCGGAENRGFDDALDAFAEQYGDQNARDHQALVEAVAAGRFAGIEAAEGD
ncbi:DUF2252 domain-containing protein [Aureimonas phyllosphaerae]|uniref:Uncharacterized protein (DUF2252 family) n=1 Tax=Aureimonas phyllosphaerae TaxID=1166078 RepID=A0A7W6BWI2_9HYPH|nr:DUF2252 domain-containing protein [Aureimonas phyllosphaerae]MBB3937640.1 uncharacterized protein (DUF2252 family) [Aureimonas phyllosphaerae]MBB3961560.1 uncharacterized protein (DUF2252 family) [Aureimonas phyllosphaerae]SFF55586.1 Uncharacterized conserved protein, DUF2252 family [Aureimonas phyllosphaerae]